MYVFPFRTPVYWNFEQISLPETGFKHFDGQFHRRDNSMIFNTELDHNSYRYVSIHVLVRDFPYYLFVIFAPSPNIRRTDFRTKAFKKYPRSWFTWFTFTTIASMLKKKKIMEMTFMF